MTPNAIDSPTKSPRPMNAPSTAPHAMTPHAMKQSSQTPHPLNPRVLVAGIGNIFRGDDGFGVEVVRRLQAADVCAHASVADYGIRGLHLAYDMLAGGYQTTILVDALSRGGAPGDLYVFEPGPVAPDAVPVDAHGMHPAAVLALIGRLGGSPGRVLVVGCEPASLDEGVGLSAPVAASVDEAVRQTRDLIRKAAADAGYPLDEENEAAPCDRSAFSTGGGISRGAEP